MPGQTPSQTVGPFFDFGLIFPGEEDLLRSDPTGERIMIRGAVFDGDGAPVPDAMIETWQADANGIYNHPADPRSAEAGPHFTGFARAATDPNGAFSIRTVKPGAVDGQAPHIGVRVFARGMLIHAYTRIYFADEPSNAQDPVLNLPGVGSRAGTLIAAREDAGGEDAGGVTLYRFDIRLQGDRETVFFDP
jgi:protocatechuate 3,4-dioxygenase alpha subunit